MQKLTLKDLLISARFIAGELDNIANNSNAKVYFLVEDKNSDINTFITIDDMFNTVLHDAVLQIDYDKPVLKYSDNDLYNKIYLPALDLAMKEETKSEGDEK